MNNGILIIAHAPLASALCQCVAHVFPDRAKDVLAVDVAADASTEQSVIAAKQQAARFGKAPLLLLTDMLGGTPCNVARQLLDAQPAQLVTGVNLPMVLRAVTYQHEPLVELVARALNGGVEGVLRVEV